jgi:hypothetical protein
MWVSMAVLVSWLFLCALQYGLVPIARYAWAVNLWAYQPSPVGPVLATLALTVVFSGVRERLAAAARRLVALLGGSPGGELVIGLGAAVIFWLLRDNELSPDARIFGGAMLAGQDLFFFPDVGASWTIFRLAALARTLGMPLFSLVQAASCVAGGVTVALLTNIARCGLLGRRRMLGLATTLLLSGGLVRVFAGRVESYALLLVAVTAYVWLALRYLEDGRGEHGRGWYATCLAFGVSVLLHAVAITVLPSLLLLPRLATPGLRAGAMLRMLVRGGAVAALPLLAFVLGIAFVDGGEHLGEGVHRVIEVLGRSEAAGARRWWVRGWGGAPSIGTDYVLLSMPHLKFIANNVYLLCPSALGVLVVLFSWRGREILRDSRGRLLFTLCVPPVFYMFALRPAWGPYDWDVFALTALVLVLLQAHALDVVLRPQVARHVAIWLIAFQLLFVGAPFLVLRASSARDAGPFFVEGYFSPYMINADTPPTPALAPWL